MGNYDRWAWIRGRISLCPRGNGLEITRYRDHPGAEVHVPGQLSSSFRLYISALMLSSGFGGKRGHCSSRAAETHAGGGKLCMRSSVDQHKDHAVRYPVAGLSCSDWAA